MALICFMDNVNFRNFAEEHEHCVGEILRGKLNFVLTDRPYNVRRHRKDDYAKYVVFSSKALKYMAKVLEDFVKPGAHRHVFCFDLSLALSSTGLSFQKRGRTRKFQRRF